MMSENIFNDVDADISYRSVEHNRFSDLFFCALFLIAASAFVIAGMCSNIISEVRN